MLVRVLKLPGVALLIAMACANTTHAATTTQTVNLGYVPTNVNFNFSFNQFDYSLGTLDSVVTTFSGDFLNSFGFMNFGSATNVEAEFIQKAMLKGPDNTVIYNSGRVPNTFQSAVGADRSSKFSLGADLNEFRPLPLRTFGGAHTWDGASGLGAFAGGGTVTLPFAGSAVYLSRVGNGFASVLGQTQVRAVAELTYNFTPTAVPEPETYVMLLAGLSVTWLRFRRSGAKNKRLPVN